MPLHATKHRAANGMPFSFDQGYLTEEMVNIDFFTLVLHCLYTRYKETFFSEFQ